MSKIHRMVEKLGIKIEREKNNRLMALCPFHVDTDPSFFVRIGERAGQWYCFVCKEGGGFTELVYKIRGYAVMDSAIRWIKEFQDDAPPPPSTSARVEVSESTSRTFTVPEEVIFEPLDDWVTPVRRYAVSRGITAEQVESHGIGYAVDGRLAGRLVLVTRDYRLVAASYAARSFADEEPRYLYPMARENAKHTVLWGEPTMADANRGAFLSEGAIDALAVERVVLQTGFASLALGGSHIRPEHLMKLSLLQRVIVATDDDKAGNDAWDRLRAALSRHVILERLKFRGGDAAKLSEKDRHEQVAPFTFWSKPS